MTEVQELVNTSKELIKTIEQKESETVKPIDRLLFRIAGAFFVVGFVFFVSNIVITNSNIASLTEIVKQNVISIQDNHKAIAANHNENGRFLSLKSFIAIEAVLNKRIVDLIIDTRFRIREEELEAARTKGYEKLREPIRLGTTRSIN